MEDNAERRVPGSNPESPPSPAGKQGKTDNSFTNRKYKNLCPFACPNCATLGEYLGSKYEVINVLADNGDSIFSPMDEKYTEEHKTSVRNGKVFLSADLINDFLKKLKK